MGWHGSPHLRRLGFGFVGVPERPGPFVLTEVNRSSIDGGGEAGSLSSDGALELPFFSCQRA